jgi:hypothetical protein
MRKKPVAYALFLLILTIAVIASSSEMLQLYFLYVLFLVGPFMWAHELSHYIAFRLEGYQAAFRFGNSFGVLFQVYSVDSGDMPLRQEILMSAAPLVPGFIVAAAFLRNLIPLFGSITSFFLGILTMSFTIAEFLTEPTVSRSMRQFARL